MVKRCPWCGDDPLYRAYHDIEWGVPERDSRALWEKLVLDGFQAGLAWITILRKREAFRAAFAGFEPATIARWSEDDVRRLLADAGIVRHRGKIEAAIGNARAWLRARGGRGVRAVPVGLRGRRAAAEPVRHDGGCAGRDAGQPRDVEGAQGARLQVLRADDLLRLHAGDGHGQRPPRCRARATGRWPASASRLRAGLRGMRAPRAKSQSSGVMPW